MLKNPPPFVPNCLMASMKPTGPSAMVCETPLKRVVHVDRAAQRLHAAPWPTKMRPPTMAIGSRT